MGRAAAAAAQKLLAWARGIPSRSRMQVLTALLDFPKGGRAAAAAATAQKLLAWARGIPSRSRMQVLTARDAA